MPKVQVYLGAEEMDLLAAEAVRAGVSRSELVRGQSGASTARAASRPAMVLGAELLTTSVRHFPMFTGLQAPY